MWRRSRSILNNPSTATREVPLGGSRLLQCTSAAVRHRGTSECRQLGWPLVGAQSRQSFSVALAAHPAHRVSMWHTCSDCCDTGQRRASFAAAFASVMDHRYALCLPAAAINGRGYGFKRYVSTNLLIAASV
jgi:hypothetical protein